MARFLSLFLCVFVCSFSFGADAFPDDLLAVVPASADSIFLLHFDRIRAFPFHDVFDKQTPFAGAERKLAPLKLVPEFGTCAFFFTSGEPGMLLRSSLSLNFMREISKTKVLQDTLHSMEEFMVGDIPCVRFCSKELLPREFNSAASAAAFLPNHIAFFAEERFLRKSLAGKHGVSPAIRSVLNKLSPGYAVAGVLSPARFAGLDSGVRGDAGLIAFSLARRKGMPSPVIGEVLLFPKEPVKINRLYRSVRDYFETAYRNAATQGPISPEMRRAFTVTLSFGFVRIDAALTDENAKDFLALLFEILRSTDK